MSLLLRENKLCMETKGKRLFLCVTSESQPGHVNTLWVELKCYRADETHSHIQYEFSQYIFLGVFNMQSVMLISIHV